MSDANRDAENSAGGQEAQEGGAEVHARSKFSGSGFAIGTAVTVGDLAVCARRGDYSR